MKRPLVVASRSVGTLQINSRRDLHCIKGATVPLADYAEKNGGRFPSSEEGWADALLKLDEHRDPDAWIAFIKDPEWVEFVDSQQKLLREAGLSEDTILEVYGKLP